MACQHEGAPTWPSKPFSWEWRAANRPLVLNMQNSARNRMRMPIRTAPRTRDLSEIHECFVLASLHFYLKAVFERVLWISISRDNANTISMVMMCKRSNKVKYSKHCYTQDYNKTIIFYLNVKCFPKQLSWIAYKYLVYFTL